MRVVNVSGSRRLPPVEVDVSPVYDFLLSPIVTRPSAVEYDEYELTAAWQALVGPRGGLVLLAELERLIGTLELVTVELAALTVLGPEAPKAVPAFLDQLAATPPEVLATLILDRPGEATTELPEPGLIAAALAGDRAAVGQVLGRFTGDQRRRAALWLADPAGVRDDLLGWLRRWYDGVFAAEEAHLLAACQRDATAKRRLAAEQGPAALLSAIGGTLQMAFGPTIQRVVLAPAVLGRPALFFIEHDQAGMQMILYPVADEYLEEPEPLAPPRALLRLYKALGDETRLKILRLVADQPLYATEIAERLGLAKATVSHHMVLLRAAGLVEVTGDRKPERYYGLHRPTLDEPAALLKRYLRQ